MTDPEPQMRVTAMSNDRAAFVLAAIAAALTVPLTMLIYVAFVEGLPNGVNLGGAFLYFVTALIVISIAGLFIGIPIVWILRRRLAPTLPLLALSGVISGAAANWLILPSFTPFFGAVAGFAAAITWWFMAERKHEIDA